MTVLKRIDRALARLEGWLIVLFLSLMVTLTFLQVILRALYAYAHMHWANTLMGTMAWSEPLARLLVLWLTFLGASLATREKKHIKIDVMSGLLPLKWHPFRELILAITCGFLCLLMIKASVEYVGMEMTFGGSLFLGIPTWAGQLILPLGFSVILFRCVLRGIEEGVTLLRGNGP